MKTISTIILALLFSLNLAMAQDTLYIYKSGLVVSKRAVTDVDSIIFYKSASDNTITDYDGNVYNTVTIGTQTWMKQNLKTSHYADGTAIPLVTGNSNWMALTATSKAYCWYNNDSATNANTYGALYTWPAAMNGATSSSASPSGIQGVCPTGWHLPSDAEWTTLENYMIANGYNYDSTTTVNKIAKALASDMGWISSSDEGAVGNTDYPTYRNKSGFTALPGGDRDYLGSFNVVGYYGFWWSSSESSASFAWSRSVNYVDSYVYRDSYGKLMGFSVRCLRD